MCSEAEHENWLYHHSALCRNSNSCHLVITFQPTVLPWTPTEYLTNSDYTGPNYKNNPRLNISFCLLATFSTATSIGYTQASQPGNYLPASQVSYPRRRVSSSSHIYAWEETAQSVSGSSEPNYTCRCVLPYGVTSCSHRDTGTCVSSYVKYTADQCDSYPSSMVALWQASSNQSACKYCSLSGILYGAWINTSSVTQGEWAAYCITLSTLQIDSLAQLCDITAEANASEKNFMFSKSVQLQYFCHLHICHGEHVAERFVKNPASTVSYWGII
jgi:hypothetical protein